jgi:hypothetical protein
MRKGNWSLIITIAAALLLLATTPRFATAKSYTFSSFDFPGAQTGGNDINAAGEIVGNYFPGFHGFLDNKGVFTNIDVPFPSATLTSPQAINSSGQIVGYYETGEPTFFIGPDTRGIHGYLDDARAFSTIDVPFSGALPDWTVPGFILPNGTIVGTYLDSNIVFHGFLKEGDSFTSIDVPFTGALATVVGAMSPSGKIVGLYADSGGILHGFVDDRGSFSTFDVPFTGASLAQVNSINPEGEIDGVFLDSSGVPHGFVDDRDAFTQLDFPRAGCITASLAGNNSRGQITGTYFCDDIAHGFVATPK